MAFTIPKPLEFIPQNTKFRFVSMFKLWFGVSSALMLLTVVLLLTAGLNFGIDFRGGTLIELRTTKGPADMKALREQLSALRLGEMQIQEFGGPDLVLVRVAEQPGGEQAQQLAQAKIKGALGDGVEIRRTEVVGGTVSSELLGNAVLAVLLTCAGIFAYVWLRFEWQFALGAVVALFHDVFITVGVFSALQIDFDLTIVAALLTILGYSINDTVVIYDRIRENLRKYKKKPLEEVIDQSINETLSRTIMTVSTTLLALLALYIFGGEVIRGFTFAMLFGCVFGTYSSVFIAAPFLILLGVKRDWSGVAAPKAASGRNKVADA
jgi:preprotein translocase subunit SecF